jgi:hypothetical protein
MKGIVICLAFLTLSVSVTNTQQPSYSFNPNNKIFIITLDGFRWQELFYGADSVLINDVQTTADTALNKKLYWSSNASERRKKLMPFVWTTIAENGQLYGNRNYDNNVNVANPYALSYPGYNELLTGAVDLTIYNNSRTINDNKNLLQHLSSTNAYRGKVAAFTSWNMFPYILNNNSNDYVLNSPSEDEYSVQFASDRTSRQQQQPTEHPTRSDRLTFAACKEYVALNQPSIVFVSFSGTDDAGHNKTYSNYLQQAHEADKMISELWTLIQSMPQYAHQTTFLITTDHGRGNTADTWYKHGFFVPGSSQTWMGLIGNHVVSTGELRMSNQLHLKDVKSLIMRLLASR